MNQPCWRLDGAVAQLTGPKLQATVDLTRPWQGLYGISLGGQSLSVLRPMQLLTDPSGSPEQEELQDCYVRGEDLIVTYQQNTHRPVSPQVYWRFLDASRFAGAAGVGNVLGWELILSIQTSLLDIRWELTSQTEIANEVSEGFQVEVAHKRFLYILPVTDRWAYLEIVHPTDQYREDAIFSDQEMRLIHNLFAERMEKGVIRRARLRGLLIPRGDEQRIAKQLWHHWKDEPPPLTT